MNTPRVLTNSAGTAVWQWDGEAFGNTPPNNNPSGLGPLTFNLRFPGQYYDAETNLNQNYFRDYDSTAGRYVESDLIGLKGGISTFGYVQGNPLSGVDPLGLMDVSHPPMPPGYVPPPYPYDPNFGPTNCGHYAEGTVLRTICENSGNFPNLNCARKCLKDKLPKDDNGNTCPVKESKQPPVSWYLVDHPVCWTECRFP